MNGAILSIVISRLRVPLNYVGFDVTRFRGPKMALQKKIVAVAPNEKRFSSALIRFGIKAGITSSAIYITVDHGVWRDSETTTELYYKIKRGLAPLVKPVVDQIPFELPEVPKAGDVCSSAKTAWNKGVMASCQFLSNFSDTAWDHTVTGIKYSYEKIREQLDSTEGSKT